MPLPPSPPTGVVLQTPTRLQVARYVRNGLIPDALFETDLTNSLNFTAGCRNKELFRGLGNIAAIPTGTAVSRDRWRFAARTSPLLRKIRVIFYAALQNNGDPVFNPKITLTITNANESVTYGSCSFYFGGAVSANTDDVPNEFGYAEIELFGVPASTTIYGRFSETEQARLISATVYEESKQLTSTNGYVFPKIIGVGSPIRDDRRQDVFELARDLWTDGAAHLFNWTVDNQASPITNATTTAKNIVDDTAGTAGPKWRLDARYCGTRARPSTVPCLLAMRTKMSTTTANGQIRLRGVNGGLISTSNLNGTTTERWTTAAVDLPAALDDYFVDFLVSSGTGTLSVYAVSLFQLA